MDRKILFVTDEMSFGGVSRVLNNLLRELVKHSAYEIDLLVLHKHGEMLNDVPDSIHILEGTPFFQVIDCSLSQLMKDKNIPLLLRKLYLLGLMKTGLISKKIKKERKKMGLQRYDVEIAFKEGFCTIFVANGESKKKVNWIHLDYKKQNFSSNHMPLLKKALVAIDANIAVSEVAAASYQEVFHLKDKVEVIHNIIQSETILNMATQPIDKKEQWERKENELVFLSVGRLVNQKGYDRLIAIHDRLIKEGLRHKIIVIGNGEEEENLKQEIKKRNCQNSFKLIGYKDNPFAYFKYSDCFLLPSRYEGLPTVVFESLICQTPVIATKVAGIEEQIKGEDYGIIVENNDEAFYQAMKKVIEQPSLLSNMRENLSNYSYNNERIINQVKSLVEGDLC